jgi:(p)ppGpp synthase/HD superfamily hydrolase
MQPNHHLPTHNSFKNITGYDLGEWFATAAHAAVGQKRRNGDPYIVHPRRVSQKVAHYFPNDEAMRTAAILHDVLEDTKVKKKLLSIMFNDDVAELVSEVTKVSKKTDGDRATRQAIDRVHLAKASMRGKCIKLCDIQENLTDDPLADVDFMKVYVPEKRLVLEECMQDVRAAYPLIYLDTMAIITYLEKQLDLPGSSQSTKSL